MKHCFIGYETLIGFWTTSDKKMMAKEGKLEKQEIYFASPSELSDPMEGFSNIVFKGDKIV